MALAAATVPALVLSRWLGRSPSPRARPARTAAALALLVLGALAARRAEPRGWDLQDEWRFLTAHEDLLRQVGTSLPLVRFARGDDEDAAFPCFPTYRLPRGAPLYKIADLLDGRVPLPALYYRGTHCSALYNSFLYTGEERPRCAEVERRFRLEPVATQLLTSGPFTGGRAGSTPRKPIEIGFFRVVGPR
jgi:hypothetical protein